MKIHKRIVEEIRITGPSGESKQALRYCDEHGYRITQVGPRRISSTQYDPDEYEVIGEREISRASNETLGERLTALAIPDLTNIEEMIFRSMNYGD